MNVVVSHNLSFIDRLMGNIKLLQPLINQYFQVTMQSKINLLIHLGTICHQFQSKLLFLFI